MIAVYVDDIIILTYTNIASIDNLKSHLHATFNFKDIGIMPYFLGMKIVYPPIGDVARNFTSDRIQASSITDLRLVVIPLPLTFTRPYFTYTV